MIGLSVKEFVPLCNEEVLSGYNTLFLIFFCLFFIFLFVVSGSTRNRNVGFPARKIFSQIFPVCVLEVNNLKVDF